VKRINVASVVFSFIIILFYSSCSKIDTTDLGNELIPAGDNVDTKEIVFNVITDNKLFNDTTRMLDDEDHGVGIIENDPEFGKTTAVTYSSFTPTNYGVHPFTKRDSVTIDSVVLSLGYSSTFGDSNAIQQFEVRQINTSIKSFKDSLYFLNAPDFDVYPQLIGNATVNYKSLNDTVVYKNGKDTIITGRELRMKLDTSWARQFVNFDTTNAYKNDTVFKQNFAGFEIKASDASASKNAIAYFNLSDNDRTRITFYCRVRNSGKTDTIAPFFTYTNDPHANIIHRTPANGYLANVNNSTENDEKLYIQSTPGSYATVKIPQLDTFANSVIHRAELIMEKYPSVDESYRIPQYLFVNALSPSLDSAFTIRNDFVITNTAPGYDLNILGGTFRNNQFVVNLTRYVQSIVTKKFRNFTLQVYAPFTTQPYYMPATSDEAGNKIGIIIDRPVAAGRVVLYGGGSTDPKRMRLRIIYSAVR
jgi:hypothetical protein